MSDTVNGSWGAGLSPAIGPDGNSVWVQVFEFKNTAAGTPTVSFSWTGGGTGYLQIFEVGTSDTTTASTVNGSMQSAPGTGTDAVTSGAVTISGASTLIATSADTNSINATDEPTAGTGFTARANGTNNAIGAWRTESGAFSSNQAGTFTAVTGGDTFVTIAVAVPNGSSTPGPTITSVSSVTPANGSSLTINASGGGFGASQGAGSVTIGGITQSVTSWSDTSINVTVDRGTNKYGATVNVVVQPNTGSPSDPYALTSLQPQSGWTYVDVGTPAADPFTRLTARPDFASGDQVAYDTVGGLVSVATDLTFSVDPSVYSWQYEAWSAGSGWSPLATQVMYAAATVDGGRDAVLMRALARPRPTQLALDVGSWGGRVSTSVLKWFAPELAAGAGGSTTFKTLTASTATSAALVRQPAAIRSAAQSEAPTLTRQVGAIRSASSSAAGAMQRAVSAVRSATQSSSAILTTGLVLLRTLAATVTQSATVTRSVAALRSATASASATVQRAVSWVRSASQNGAATVQRAVSAVRSASTTQVATLAILKAKFLTLTASSALVPALAKSISSAKTVTQAATGALLRTAAKTLSASHASAATLATIKAKLLTLTAGVGSSATLRRAVNATRSAASATGAAFSKLASATKTAAGAASAALARAAQLVRSASQGSSATQTQLKLKTLLLTATTAAVATLRRQVSMTRSVATDAVGMLAKLLPPRTFTAVQSQVSSLGVILAPAVQVLSEFFAYDVPMASLFYDVRSSALQYEIRRS